MSSRAAVSLYAIIARSAPTAVLFRRGPSRQVLLVKWNLSNDTFEEGQWLKGRIYERRCDLSANGEFLIYFAANYKKPYFSWTAVSRPPYLTALALWPKGDAWGGGGLFADRSRILLNHSSDQAHVAADFSLPRWMRVEPLGRYSGRGEDNPIWSQRLQRDGWTLRSEGAEVMNPRRATVWIDYVPPILWEKPHPRWPERYRLKMAIRGINERQGRWYLVDHEVIDEKTEGAMQLGRTEWADWSPNGDLLFTREGAVYRIRRGSKDLSNQSELIADFADHVFEERVAPEEAARWPRS